ncbi:MAG: ATP-binding protein [Deltaproteobacteria bacterium]|nr:ATP-binding protein [Deltaproteobacteria bacterium]
MNLLSFWWNQLQIKQTTQELAKNTVRSSFNKDVAFRQWAAQHGGIYVPVTDVTPPNPYLSHISERDIQTPSGKKLTLMNPAWMMRQVMTQYSELYPIKGRITSLKLMNPINKPDDWEIKALKSFEEGDKEVFEFSDINGEPYLRFMRALYIKKECLKCHAFQNYKEGDVRGGMGVSVSMKPFLEMEQASTRALILTHGLFWNFGIALILIIAFRSKKRISELISKEVKLREVMGNLDSAQKIAKLGSFEWNIKFNELFWSNEVYSIFKYPKQEHSHIDLQFRFIHPDDVARVKNDFSLAIAGLKDLQSEYRIIREDGLERFVLTEGELVKDNEDNPSLLIGTIQDITEQKRVETTLQNSELKFRSVTETASEAIITFNHHEEITFWNLGAKRIFGYSSEETMGRFIHFIFTEDSRLTYKSFFENYSNQTLDSQVTNSIELFGLHKDLSEFDCEISLSKWKIMDQPNYTVIIRDITAQKNYENELRSAKETAEAASQAKNRFLSTMSHELRTPLNGVLGMTELALLTKLNDTQQEYLKTISQSGESLLNIINQILDISKVDSRSIELEPTQFKIKDVVDNIIGLFTSSFNSKKLNLTHKFDKKIPIFLIGDSSRLNQILSNLIANAIKFTDKGKIAIDVSMVAETNSDITLRFEIKDTGVGIPEDKIPIIFQSFTQADNSTTRRFGGTGLGLAIVSRLVELMNGSYGVESVVDEGSTFWFILSFKKLKSGSTTAQIHKTTKKDNKPDKKIINILLVEDDILNQTVVGKMLTSIGYHVDILPNGKAALDILADYSYDLIIMDCLMPIMDGFEATRNIRKMEQEGIFKKKTPIVALTAKALKGDKEECFKAGMDGFLSKPVTIEDLKSTLNQYIEAR